jgi:hypothetical protein
MPKGRHDIFAICDQFFKDWLVTKAHLLLAFLKQQILVDKL